MDDYSKCISLAQDALFHGRQLEAFNWFKQASELEDSYYPLMELAVLSQENNLIVQAEHFYTSAFEKDAMAFDLRLNYAIHKYLYQKEYHKADELFCELIQEFSNTHEVFTEYSNFIHYLPDVNLIDHSKAKTLLINTFAQSKGLNHFYDIVFAMQKKAGLFSEATELIEQLIEAEVMDTELFYVADDLGIFTNFTTKERLLEKMIRKQDAKPYLLKMLIKSKLDRKVHPDEVMGLFELLFKAEPFDPKHRTQLAQYLFEKGVPAKADKHLFFAADIAYSQQLYQFGSWLLYGPCTDTGKALEIFAEALKHNPLNDQICVEMVRCAAALNNHASIRRYSQMAISLNPKNRDILKDYLD
jgi:tetratricopeptide (TPR) repeat protein